MPDLPTSAPPAASPGDQGQHYQLIKRAIPTCLVNSSAQRRNALKQTPVKHIPDWYDAASQVQKDQLKALLEKRCESLNVLEKIFAKIPSLQAFAAPLLSAALKAAGHALDIEQTWLRLYVPAEDAFGVGTGGYKVKTLSLLQAALNNFEARETQEDFYNSVSGFITKPDAREHFERHATTLKIHQFAQLCRELDLGAKYQAHLKALLEPEDGQALEVLRAAYISHQKDAFKAAACLALLKGDISDSDYALLLRVAAGEQRIMVGDQQVWYCRPCIMNLHMHDCLIIEPCVKYRYSTWFIVYIPDDPDHPIKRYESLNAFRNDLTQRLTASSSRIADRSQGWMATPTQLFFGQFIAAKDRAYYYRRLTELVVDAPPQPFGAQWLRSEWGRLSVNLVAPSFLPINSMQGEAQPEVRVSITGPNFNIHSDAINGLWGEIDLWPWRYESMRKRLLADARNQAVSTADTDAASGARRLGHYLSIGMFGLNLAAMVVPPLGATMAVVMAGQLLYEIMDGAIELSEGDREAGWAHITDVVEQLAVLAAQAGVFHLTVSPFVEELKQVTLPGGKTRLWKPDLSTYEQPLPSPSGLAVDEQGLYKADGKTLLPLDGKSYAVQQDPVTEDYRILHPTRPDAYQPRLTGNGSGLWNHELEQPQTWAGAKLMRRLGPVAEGFSDVELEQVRNACDVSEDVLRRVHVEGEPAPGILLDTLRQFRAYDDAVNVAEGIRAGSLSSSLCSFAAALTVELPRWPANMAIEAFEGTELRGPSIKYGNPQASAADTLRIHRGDLMAGKLPGRVIDALSEAQADDLVGSYTPRTHQARTEALTVQLEQHAISVRRRMMNSIYADQQPPSDTAIMLLQRDFSRLPTIMARELLADVPAAELERMNTSKRIPLHLAQKARLAQQQMRLTLAYEGLYLDAMAGPDTEALVLNSLQRLPGWVDDLRLEVRDGSLDGTLRASYGGENAAERKVLVRLGDGRYQARNVRDEHLHDTDDIYVSLQHALTDRHREALGLPHIKQGAALKAKLIEYALPREQLRQVLGMQPERKPFFRWPQRFSARRLGYPLSGRGQGSWRASIEARVRRLYRTMNNVQMVEYLKQFNLEDDSWLRALEAEYAQLDTVLTQWQIQGMDNRPVFNTRRKISRAIRQAWQKSGEWDLDAAGNYRGQRFTLEGPDVGAQLATLPVLPGDFAHVTSVYLSNCGLTDASVGVLGSFPRARLLELAENGLTQVPQALAGMRLLEGLDLADNQIVLTEQTALYIRGMRKMMSLSLEDNPLAMPVDISQMRELIWLHLGGCGLQEWPVGLFAKPRPRRFLLDLMGNRLTSIPNVAPGSERAAIVARTVVSREYLTDEVLDTLNVYIEAAGIDPNRRFPVRGAMDSVHWQNGIPTAQWPTKQAVWDAVEAAHGSEGFFDELRKLSQSSDTRTPAFKDDLTAKVWRMLEAMANDEELRERLFQMATAPTTCVDSGAQLFNAMGVEVLVHEAQSLRNEFLKKLELLDLAKGKARLDELGRIARARVSELLALGARFPEYDEHGDQVTQYDAQGLAVRSIDEVEIHLVYVTQLATRLDLPWQSRSMQFNEPYVEPQMIETAYDRVLALENGDLLREGILEQEFWVEYVEAFYAKEFETVDAKNDALINLYVAQQDLATDTDLSPGQRAELRSTIETSAGVLGKSADQVLSDDEYFADVASFGVERKNVLRSVTDRAMGRRASTEI